MQHFSENCCMLGIRHAVSSKVQGTVKVRKLKKVENSSSTQIRICNPGKPPDDLPDATASTIQPHYGGKIVTGLEWGGRLWDWTAWEYMPIEYPENGLPSPGC